MSIYQQKRVDGIKKNIHRIIMEEHLGRLLESCEHVYHVNGDPHDNRLENLIVIHMKYKKKT